MEDIQAMIEELSTKKLIATRLENIAAMVKAMEQAKEQLLVTYNKEVAGNQWNAAEQSALDMRAIRAELKKLERKLAQVEKWFAEQKADWVDDEVISVKEVTYV